MISKQGDLFFWLGEDALEDVDEKTFEKRQKEWDGPRPSDFEENPLNVQEGGTHYKKYAIQPVEFAMSNDLNLCQANVVKYVVRYKDKGGIEDLKKAKHYIDILIRYEEETVGETAE